MPSVSSQRYAASLTAWLKSCTSAERVASIAEEVGFNIPTFFGRRTRKLRVLTELVIAHSALAILAVNLVYDGEVGREIIDAFLDCARSEVFARLQAEDATFKSRYEDHIAAYFKTFSGRSLMGAALACLHFLDLGIDRYLREGIESFKGGDREAQLMKRFERALQDAVSQLERRSGGTDNTPGGEKRASAVEATHHVGFVGMMDVDNFDFINEKLGRAAGDEVMRAYVRLTASKAGTDTILNETGFHALQDELTRRRENIGCVLCRPYSSGDEFIVFHQDLGHLRDLLDAICRAAEDIDIPLSDASGRVIGVLHGIPISRGYGASRTEAWKQLLAEKHGGKRRGMAERLELRNETSEAAPSEAELREVMQSYLEVLKDEGTTARPTDFAATLQYAPPSDKWPPDWPGVPLCGCCAAPFAVIARRDGLWVAKGLRDGRPVPLCAVCITHLNHLALENGPARFALSPTYDVVGQQLAARLGTKDVRKIAVMRVSLVRARLKPQT